MGSKGLSCEGGGKRGRTFLDGEAVELREGVRSSEKEGARNLCGCYCWLTFGEFGGSGLVGEGGLEKSIHCSSAGRFRPREYLRRHSAWVYRCLVI